MADNYEFCMAQAESARKSAEAATLANVRENFERAEKTWTALASKAQRVSVARVEREEASAARVAAANENAELEQAALQRSAAE
jgi:predicted RNA-binding protein with PUA-like domain